MKRILWVFVLLLLMGIVAFWSISAEEGDGLYDTYYGVGAPSLNFTVTNHRLYESPPFVMTFPDTVTFVLERQSGLSWTYVQTVSSNASGWVNFTSEFTAHANYRIRKTTVPMGWFLPLGHWQFPTNEQRQMIGIPVAHGGNPAFVNNPSPGNAGLHVGSMPMSVPTPSPSPPLPYYFSFRKTNQQLYETPPIVMPLPGIATFVLERQSGAIWLPIQTVTNTANGMVEFTTRLTPNATYRLRETAAPTGWILQPAIGYLQLLLTGKCLVPL